MDYIKKYHRDIPRCLECGGKISYGRSDKKYCCEDCRTRHHNHLAQTGRGIRRRIVSILEKNYRYLNSLAENDVDTVPMLEALAKGFNPDFFTSVKRSACHQQYCCFDIVYRMTPQRLSHISKYQNVSVSLSDENDDF